MASIKKQQPALAEEQVAVSLNGHSDHPVSKFSAEHMRTGGATSEASPTTEGDGEKLEKDVALTPEPEKPAMPKAKVFIIALALCLAVFLSALDVTIVTTALPTIAADFKATEGDYTWIGSSYMLSAAATTPSWGKISDIFGRKPVILTANVVFFVGSLVCALSINVHMLLAGRVLQGIGAGGLQTLAVICIADMFSVRERGLYFSLVGLTWALAGSIGPVIGGAFSTYASWRWNFWLNLPLDGIAFAILVFFLDIHNPKTPFVAGIRAIDWIGTVLVISGTCMFLLGLNFGGVTYPWDSATVICLLIFGILALVAFAVHESRWAKYPIMPSRLFKNRSNVAALILPFLHGFVYVSDSYFLPQYFQVVLGATPLLSGVYLLPFIVTLSLFSALTGVFIKKTGQYLPPIYLGFALLALGHGLYIDLPPYGSWARIILFQFIVGLGAGPNFQAPLIALHSGIEARDTAASTSTYNFARNLGTAISVVVGGSIFSNQITARRSELAAALPPALVDRLSNGGIANSRLVINALPPAQNLVVRVVCTESLRTLWIFYTCIALTGLGVCFLLKKAVLSKKHNQYKTGLISEEEQGRRDAEEVRKLGGDVEANRDGVEEKPEAGTTASERTLVLSTEDLEKGAAV